MNANKNAQMNAKTDADDQDKKIKTRGRAHSKTIRQLKKKNRAKPKGFPGIITKINEIGLHHLSDGTAYFFFPKVLIKVTSCQRCCSVKICL